MFKKKENQLELIDLLLTKKIQKLLVFSGIYIMKKELPRERNILIFFPFFKKKKKIVVTL